MCVSIYVHIMISIHTTFVRRKFANPRRHGFVMKNCNEKSKSCVSRSLKPWCVCTLCTLCVDTTRKPRPGETNGKGINCCLLIDTSQIVGRQYGTMIM